MRPAIRFCRSADGTRLAHATRGSGPVLVQAPTWLTHLERDAGCAAWRPWIDQLARRRTLVRYDLRGCGLSDRRVAAQDLDRWVEDLLAVVDDLELDRFPLLGMCQGAGIAAAFAARHPERVSRLVLYGSYLKGGLVERNADAAPEVTAMATLIETGWGRSTPAFRELFARLLMPAAPPAAMHSLAEMEGESADAATAHRLWLAFHRLDVSAEVPHIHAPTLVVHARRDSMVSFADGCRMAAAVPGARFLPLDSWNHILHPDEPAWGRFWEAIEGFLDEERGAADQTPILPELTPRERDVLELIAQGRRNDEIAARLGIEVKTVRNHVTRIFDKLGAQHRAEAAVLALTAGLGRPAARDVN